MATVRGMSVLFSEELVRDLAVHASSPHDVTFNEWVWSYCGWLSLSMYVVIQRPTGSPFLSFIPSLSSLKFTMVLLIASDHEQIAIYQNIAERSVAPFYHLRLDSYQRQRPADATAKCLIGDFEKGTYRIPQSLPFLASFSHHRSFNTRTSQRRTTSRCPGTEWNSRAPR